MGQASRWLRSIFTRSRKENDNNRNRNISSKSKWIANLLKSCKDSRGGAAATISVVAFSSDSGKSLRGGRIARGDDHDSAQRSSECYAIVDDYSHAKAVAAATATAAEAAVIAAQAAAEVVRLTRSGRLEFDPSRRASVVIQSVFRGYLARRALRALRALVRLQALVRGHIVRKRAVEQVRRMHALIRAQARARAIRALVPPSSHSRILDPPTSDDNDHAAQMWNSCKSDKRSHPGRASSKHYDEKQIDKIVMEADSSAKPHGSTKNKNLFLVSDNCSNGYQTPAFSYTSEDLLYLQYSKEIDQHSFYTADNSPRFHTGYRSSSARRGGGGGSSLASSNVNYSESCLDGYTNHPNYMAYTKSSKAKLRSLSAPKQRTQLDRSNSLKCCSSYDYGSRRLSTSGAN